MKQKKIALIVFSTFLILPIFFAHAAKWQKDADAHDNEVYLEGKCSTDVTVYLYLNSDSGFSDPVYNAGSPCKDGKFEFQDDLSRWHLPQGTYNVLVGDGQHDKDTGHVEQVVVAPLAPSDSTQITDPDAQFKNAENNLSSSLQSVSSSVDQLKQTLPSTTFEGGLQRALAAVLDAMQSMVIKFESLLTSIDQLLAGNSNGNSASQPARVNSNSTVQPQSTDPQQSVDQKNNSADNSDSNAKDNQVVPKDQDQTKNPAPATSRPDSTDNTDSSTSSVVSPDNSTGPVDQSQNQTIAPTDSSQSSQSTDSSSTVPAPAPAVPASSDPTQ